MSRHAKSIGAAVVGVVAGVPTGFSAQYWVDRRFAVQGAAAWNPGTGGLTGTTDALVHTASMSNESEISLPLYAGLGATPELFWSFLNLMYLH